MTWLCYAWTPAEFLDPVLARLGEFCSKVDVKIYSEEPNSNFAERNSQKILI